MSQTSGSGGFGFQVGSPTTSHNSKDAAAAAAQKIPDRPITQVEGDPTKKHKSKETLSKKFADAEAKAKGVLEEMPEEHTSTGASPFDLLTGKTTVKQEVAVVVDIPVEELAQIEVKGDELPDVPIIDPTKTKMKPAEVEVLAALSQTGRDLKGKKEEEIKVVVKEEDKDEVPPSLVGAAAVNIAPTTVAIAPTAHVDTEMMAKTSTQARVTTVQIVEQMISKLSQVISDNKTETVVELKYPPLFAGVSVVVTHATNASKEFNIAFYNLTNPDARLLIETRDNQALLREGLLQKGYVLHQVVIEPKVEGTAKATSDEANLRQRTKDDSQQRDMNFGKRKG